MIARLLSLVLLGCPLWAQGEVYLPRGSGKGIVHAPGGALWIGANHGVLYKSGDVGRSWSEVPLPLAERETSPAKAGSGVDGSLSVSLFGFFDEKEGIIAPGSTAYGLLRTKDGGATWAPEDLPWEFSPRDIYFTGDAVRMVGSRPGPKDGGRRAYDWLLVESEDRGKTWEIVRTFDAELESLWFDNSGRGVVGGTGELWFTADGGATWAELGVPTDDPSTGGGGEDSYDPDSHWNENPPIVDVLLVGERVIATRHYTRGTTVYPETFVLDMSRGARWEHARIGEDKILAYASHQDGVVVLTAQQRLLFLDDDLQPVRFVRDALDVRTSPGGHAGGISSDAERVTVCDGRKAIAVIEGPGSVYQGSLLTREKTRFVDYMDLAGDGTFWGVTYNHLFRAHNLDEGWDLVCPLPTFSARVRATSHGGAIVMSSGNSYSWDPVERTLSEVELFKGFHPTELVREGELWLVAGAYCQDEQALEGLRQLHSTWVGDDVVGAIIVSGDGGATWGLLDDWPGGRYEALDLIAGDLVAYRAGGGIRRGSLLHVGSSVGGTLETLLDPDGSPLRYSHAFDLHFESGRSGWFRGSHYYDSTDYYFATTDGGRSWEAMNPPSVDFFELFELSSGLALAHEWGKMVSFRERSRRGLPKRGPSKLHALQGLQGAKTELFREFDSAIERGHVDGGGGLLLEMEDGAVWRLDPSGKRWTELGRN